MKKTSLFGALCTGFFILASTNTYAVFMDDFEDGNLDDWTIGGRQITPGTADVVSRHGSLMGHVSKDSFTEITLEHLYDYSTDLSFMFDMEVTSYGSGPNSTYYGSGSADFDFLDTNGNMLGRVTYGDASSNYVSTVYDSRDDRAYNAVQPDVLLRHSLSIEELIAQLSIPFENVVTLRLQFRAYASAYGSYGADVWVDNVGLPGVPIPASVWLFGSGFLGLVGVARRQKTA